MLLYLLHGTYFIYLHSVRLLKTSYQWHKSYVFINFDTFLAYEITNHTYQCRTGYAHLQHFISAAVTTTATVLYLI